MDIVASYLTRPQAVERLRGAESVLGRHRLRLVIHNVESPDRREQVPTGAPTSNGPTASCSSRCRPRPRTSYPGCGTGSSRGHRRAWTERRRDPGRPGGRRGRRVRLAGRYLLALGHRSVGFVSDSFENPYGFTSSRDRYQGFTELPARAWASRSKPRSGRMGRRTARIWRCASSRDPRPPAATRRARHPGAGRHERSPRPGPGPVSPWSATTTSRSPSPSASPRSANTSSNPGRAGAGLLLAEIEHRSAVRAGRVVGSRACHQGDIGAAEGGPCVDPAPRASHTGSSMEENAMELRLGRG